MGCGTSSAAAVANDSPKQAKQLQPVQPQQPVATTSPLPAPSPLPSVQSHKAAAAPTPAPVPAAAVTKPSPAATPIPNASTAVARVEPAPPAITLAGKIAIITGASRGIGAGIAQRLAFDGAKVIVNYHKDARSAAKVVATIIAAGGIATAIQADASKSADIDRLFAETKKLYGRVDIVVSNAAIFSASTIGATTNDEFDRVVNTNIASVFYTLRAAANNISDNGRIVVIGSIVKSGTLAGYGPYAASKVAIEVLANTLAQELGGKGITVNTLHPGPVDTDMMAHAISPNPDAIREVFANLSPQKRVGTVDDISGAVSLLVSEGARWVSGQNVAASGGAK